MVGEKDEDCMPACTFVTAHWLHPEAEEFTSVIIKNSSGVAVCSKCRKLVNGIRCTTCKKPWPGNRGTGDAVARQRMPDMTSCAIGNVSPVLAPTSTAKAVNSRTKKCKI